MATTIEINAIADIILTTFDADAQLFHAFLARAKLEAELDQLASAERVIRADFAGDQTEFNDALAANQQAQAEKQAEIDAL